MSIKNDISTAMKNTSELHPEIGMSYTTLSTYFNQTLKRADLIFQLSVFVMIFGLGIALISIWIAYQVPKNITVAIVGGVSGIVIQFVGATFLFIYRSTIAQANRYTQTLAKINSISMAMQILDGIKEQEVSESLEELINAKIEIAKLLLVNAQENQEDSDDINQRRRRRRRRRRLET